MPCHAVITLFSSSTPLPHVHTPRSCSSNSLPDPRTPLSAAQMPLLPLNSLRALLHNLLALRQNQLDMARLRHVRVDAAVGAVCAAALLGCLVHLDVLDEQGGGVEALGVGVGFGVLEQVEQVFCGLFGPAGAVGAEWLAWWRGEMLVRWVVAGW